MIKTYKGYDIGIGAIYLCSYVLFVLINNVFVTISTLAFAPSDWGIYLIGSFCGPYVVEATTQRILCCLLYLILKLSLLLLLSNLLKRPAHQVWREILLSYFIMDVLFLILYPVSTLVHFDLARYYFSSAHQYLIARMFNIPLVSASLFWTLALSLIMWLRKYPLIEIGKRVAFCAGSLILSIVGLKLLGLILNIFFAQ